MYSSENKFIFACISVKKDNETLQAFRKPFERKLNWSYILKIAKKTQIAPLLYHNLQDLECEDFIPSVIRKNLKQIYHRNGVRNLHYYLELKNILLSFETINIKTIVLKGAVLAEKVWKNVALRHMWDIDLLVQKQDLEKAEQKLYDLGYVSLEANYPKDWFKGCQHLPSFYNQHTGIITELHHDITPPPERCFLDMEDVWVRACPIKISGVKAYALCPEDLLIHLCVHLSYIHHIVGRIRDLTDIAQVVSSPDIQINWDWVIRKAHERDFTEFVYFPLFFVKEILNADIEAGILRSLRKQSTLTPIEEFLLKQVIKRNILMKDDTSTITPTQNIQRLLCTELLSRDRIFYKFIRLLKNAFLTVPRESLWRSFPKPWFIFYPVYRILEVISKLTIRTARVIIWFVWNKVRVQVAN